MGNSEGSMRLGVRAERLLDIRRGQWVAGQVLLLDGDRIDGIESTGLDGVPSINLDGLSVIPGLIDVHTHVLLQGTYDRYNLAWQMREENIGHRVAGAVRAMSLCLSRGVTTIRDLGTEGAGYADVGLRDAASEGVVPGPRMTVAGPAIRSTGTFPEGSDRYSLTFPLGVDSCTGADACRAVIRTQIMNGVDVIKIYVSGGKFVRGDGGFPDGRAVFTELELTALVDEAHRQGVKIAAHAQCLTGTKMAIDAGVDSIEHGFAISPTLAQQMADKGITLDPTLLVVRGAAVDSWYVDEEWIVTAQRRSFENCLVASVPVALGTDIGGFEWTKWSQVDELKVMVEYGQSNLEALRAATIVAAALIGQSGVLGELSTGAQADFVAVKGDPLVDISSLDQVVLVVKGGKAVYDPNHIWTSKVQG